MPWTDRSDDACLLDPHATRAVAVVLLCLGACGARTAPLVGDEPARDGSVAGCDEPAPEACNAVDDDCDGSIDEGLPLTRLGDPVVLRSPGETTTGDCRVCDQALRAEVIPVESDLLVLWQMNFLFVEPRPNTFARRVDRFGAPMEAASLWTEHLTLKSFEAAALPTGRVVMTFCERDADRDDHPSALEVDGAGRATGESVRVLSDVLCTSDGVRAGATSERLFLASRAEDRSSTLAVVGTDLRPVSTVSLGDALRVALASSPNGALVARAFEIDGVGRVWSAQSFDATGMPRGAPSTPDPMHVGFDVAALSHGEGWLVVHSGESGAGMQTLSLEGAPVGAPRSLGEARVARAVDGIGLPSGGAAVVVEVAGEGRPTPTPDRSDLHLIDRGGAVEATWSSDDLGEPVWRSPTLRAIRGQVAMVYMVDGRDELHNEVRLRFLACEP